MPASKEFYIFEEKQVNVILLPICITFKEWNIVRKFDLNVDLLPPYISVYYVVYGIQIILLYYFVSNLSFIRFLY